MYNVHVCPTVRKCLFQSSNTSCKLAKSKVKNYSQRFSASAMHEVSENFGSLVCGSTNSCGSESAKHVSVYLTCAMATCYKQAYLGRPVCSLALSKASLSWPERAGEKLSGQQQLLLLLLRTSSLPWQRAMKWGRCTIVGVVTIWWWCAINRPADRVGWLFHRNLQ